MDASNLSNSEQAVFERYLQQQQMKDMMLVYSRIVEKCFTHCCNDFTSKSLSSKEESCLSSCAEKFLGHSARIGQRFSEANTELMEKRRG